MPIVNEGAREALFGDGTKNGGLIPHVLIGANNRNPYENMHSILEALDIDARTAGGHHNHFHITLQTPTREPVPITPKKNLLVDEAILDETQGITSEDLYAAAQALLDEIQPQLNYEQGDITMFAMDMPPDVPAQNAPVVIAMASHDKKAATKTDHTIGVCHLIQNPPIPPGTAVNVISPLGQASVYLEKQEHRKLDWKSWKVSVLQESKHGTLGDKYKGTYAYNPTPNYHGPDRATFLVEIGGRKVKVLYFFKVQPGPPGGTEGYDPYEDKKMCPKGRVWKISVNPNDPNGSFFTFEQSFQLTNTFAGVTKPTLVFADLPGDAIGQTIGNTITLDINAAGHGWFIDSTPGVNEEYVETSNPNEWVARVGSDAAGKIDLLTVLAHEVGHVYGLPHSTDNASLMSEDLKPGVRHTVSFDDLKALWARLSSSISFNTGNPGDPFNPLPFVPSLFFGFNRLRLRGDTGQGISLPPLQNEPHTLVATPSPIFSMTTRNASALHTDIFNGDFSVVDPTDNQFGWVTRGRVNFDGTEAELVEDERLMSGLQQTFALPAEFRTLRFTITGADFGANGAAPVDAFEMALIDAATGQSALGAAPLANTDALLNIQSDGTVYAAPAVSINGQPVTSGSQLSFVDPVDVSIDLSALSPGAVLTLYFDLLGLGAANSRVTIDNVQIVSNLNTEPVAENDVAIVDEDSFVSIPVLANDTDAEDDPLTTFLVDAPQYGIVVQNLDGTFTYTPNADYFGSDSFTYRANDGEFDSNLATVDITVNPVNDAPIAGDTDATTAEDTPVVIDLLANASDIDDLVLTPVIVDGPSNGILVENLDGTVVYTPNANYFGTDLFTYRVRDEDLDSNLATVSIDVTPVNDAPVAVDDAVTTLEDTPLTFDARVNDYDIEGDLLTALLVAAPQHGQVLLNADGSFTYTPNLNFNGADSFTYLINDGELDSNAATVNITVDSVNDAPQGADNTVTTLEDTAYIFKLEDFGFSDANDTPANNLLAVKISSSPSVGSLTLNGFDIVAGQFIAAAEIGAGLLQFVPVPNENGVAYANLGFQVQDDGGTVNGGVDLDPTVRTLTIDVTPVNDAPVAVASTVTGNEDQPYVFSWRDFSISDVDDAIDLAVVINTLPIDGQLQSFDGTAWTTASIDQVITQAQIDAGMLRFIPEMNESGFDGYATAGVGNLLQDYAQFSYRASDGELFSEVTTVTIDITPVADAPTLNLINAEDRYGATTERFRTGWETVDNRNLKQTLVKATELEGWTLVDVQGSTSAAGAGSAGAVKAPRPDNNGDDHDDDDDHKGKHDHHDVQGSTSAAGDRKSGAADDHKHKHGHHDDEDRKDDDRGKDVFEIWSSGDKMRNASTGHDDGKDGDHDDDHKRGHNKDYDDVHGRTSVAGDRTSGATDDHKRGHNDDHHDKDGVKPYTIVYAAPGNGDNFLELNDAKGEGHQTIGIERTVSTRAGATYDLTFDYAGRVGYSTDFTRIGIYVDDVLIEQYAGTSPNEALNWESLQFSFIGTGGDQLIKIVTEPLAIEKNGRGAMIDNIALIEQLPLNTGYEDGTINLSAINAVLVDTDTSEVLSLLIEAIPVGAVLTDGTNSFTGLEGTTTADITSWDLNNLSITPPQDFFGEFVLTVKATATETANGDTASALNTITVTVIGINDAPVANDDNVTTAEDTPITIAALANDYDADGDALGVSIIAGPQNGAVVLNADGSFSYTPKANYFGTDTFTYQLNDGELDSNIATVTITITPVNDAPIAKSHTYVLEIEDDDDDKHRHDDHDSDHKDKHDGKRKGDHHSYDDDDVQGRTNTAGAGRAGAVDHEQNHHHKGKHNHHDDGDADHHGIRIDLQSLISDIEGDPLTLTVNSPTNGTLARNADGTYSYTPNTDFIGTDSFTYTVSDGELSTTATISIDVQGCTNTAGAGSAGAVIVKGEGDHHKHHDHEENQHDYPDDGRITVHSTLPEHDNKKQSDHPKSILVNWPEHDPIIVHNPHTNHPKIDWDGWESRREENNKDDNRRQHQDWEAKGWIGEFLEPNKHSSLAEQTGIKIELPKDLGEEDD